MPQSEGVPELKRTPITASLWRRSCYFTTLRWCTVAVDAKHMHTHMDTSARIPTGSHANSTQCREWNKRLINFNCRALFYLHCVTPTFRYRRPRHTLLLPRSFFNLLL
uniref:Uncharacterized protein n=1 Tax=Trypanosoma vivax (strain Y486) TaxID=1055687 RepID=G0TTC9_TRYVY|nr:conserved hypothetical protein [Trypanosoma vivax Y486]